MDRASAIKALYAVLTPMLDERSRRLLVAAESQVIGRSGITAVSKATGVSRRVIRQGMAEWRKPAMLAPGRVRRAGGGRKKAIDQDPTLSATWNSGWSQPRGAIQKRPCGGRAKACAT